MSIYLSSTLSLAGAQTQREASRPTAEPLGAIDTVVYAYRN